MKGANAPENGLQVYKNGTKPKLDSTFVHSFWKPRSCKVLRGQVFCTKGVNDTGNGLQVHRNGIRAEQCSTSVHHLRIKEGPISGGETFRKCTEMG